MNHWADKRVRVGDLVCFFTEYLDGERASLRYYVRTAGVFGQYPARIEVIAPIAAIREARGD